MYKQCTKCHRSKSESDFFLSPTGPLPVCKSCLLSIFSPSDPLTFLPVLKACDVAYVPAIFQQVSEAAAKAHRSPATILGRYMNRMHLGQYSSYHFADSVAAQTYFSPDWEVVDPTTMDLPALGEAVPHIASAASAPAQPGGAVAQPSFSPSFEIPSTPISPTSGEIADGPAYSTIHLTADEARYLQRKWGSTYSFDDLIRLETLYLSTLQDFDIRTTTEKDYLRKICVCSLRYDKAVEADASDEARRWAQMYNDMTKASGFQPIQGQENDKDSFDSVGSLVKFCESAAPIPPFSLTPGEEDKLDLVLKDYKLYLKRLLSSDDSISARIAEAARQLHDQDSLVAHGAVDDGSSDEDNMREAQQEKGTATATSSLMDAYEDLDSLESQKVEEQRNIEEVNPNARYARELNREVAARLAKR